MLQEAVKNTQYWRLRDNAGKPPGLLGWWPTRATVFIKNHDTDMRPVRLWFSSGLATFLADICKSALSGSCQTTDKLVVDFDQMPVFWRCCYNASPEHHMNRSQVFETARDPDVVVCGAPRT